MEKYFKALEGISYSEWTRLKMIIDDYFHTKKNNLSYSLQLKSDEDLKKSVGKWW